MKLEVSHEHILLVLTHVFLCHCDLHEAHQQVSLKVTNWRGLVLVACFLSTAIQHPAWDLKSGVPVEVLQSKGRVDVDGFFAWQFTRPCSSLWPLFI